MTGVTAWNSTVTNMTTWDPTVANATAWNPIVTNRTTWNSTVNNATICSSAVPTILPNTTIWNSTVTNSTAWNCTVTNATAWPDPDAAEIADLEAADRWVRRVAAIAILVVGTCGSALTLLVLPFTRTISRAVRLVLAVLAVSDLGVMWTGLPRVLLLTFDHPDPRVASTNACRALTFFTYFFVHWSSWILVVLSLERTICVVRPLTAQTYVNVRNTALALGGTALCITIIDSNFLWALDIAHGSCYLRPTYFNEEAWAYVDMSVTSLVPFLLMTCCTVLIVLGLRKSRKFTSHDKNSSAAKSRRQAERSITRMCVGLNVLFLLLTMPLCVMLIYTNHYDWDNATKLEHRRIRLGFTIVNQLAYCNAAVNFVCYCLAGRQFRAALVGLVCACRRDKGPAPGHSASTELSELHSRET